MIVNAAQAIGEHRQRLGLAGPGRLQVSAGATGPGGDRGGRRRARDERGGPGPDLRPLLHHQGRGQGHRAGPEHGARHGGAETRGADRGGDHTRPGSPVPDHAAGPEDRPGRLRPATAPRR